MERALTDKDVAKILKLTKETSWKTVQKLAREGKLRGQKIGGQWRFHPSAIADFLMYGAKSRA